MPFEIVRNDIVSMQADAIVNTANPHPVIGAGVDSAIHKKAGPQLLEARKAIGDIPAGAAAITPAFGLDADFVIHTCGPVWTDGKHGEEEILAGCYRNCLRLAEENRCESIAFPLLSTGNYGFPKPLALQIAVREISAFLMEHEMLVYLAVFDKDAFELSEKLFRSVSSYIDDNYIEKSFRNEYGSGLPDFFSARARYEQADEEFRSVSSLPDAEIPVKTDDLDQLLSSLDAGFSETLLKLIDKSGKKDSEIYKKANIDRRLFSKIRNDPDYHPTIQTAAGFAIALELSLDEACDFFARAGLALSPCSKTDMIIKYFLENKIYDVFELNEVLFKFDQRLIGA